MAAPEFTLFIKPYLEGWDDGEEGNTPITAEILNDNYDAFLLALNDWAASVGLILEEAVTDSNYVHTDNNYTSTEKDKLSGIETNANNYTLPAASTSTLGGVKIDGVTITIADGVISANIGDEVEANPSGSATEQLLKLKVGNTIYSIPEGGGGSLVPTGVTYGFTYTPGNGGLVEVTKYIDGVQDSQGHISYAEISGGGPNIVDVGDVRLSYVGASFKYQIYSKDSAHVLTYDSINYEEDDLIFEVAWNTTSESITGTITENDIVNTLLSDLGDVDISNPSNGQVLAYDLTSGKWINTNASGGTTVIGNPTGTATAVLTKIQIGNDIYSIPGGGSGGSSVSFTQILATGTKIGTITIDGVPTDIYAPTPPANTSDLNNDSNFVSDASYVHTDNNYTTTEKNKLADLNQVEANPSSGTSAGDLTSISVGGTKYNIPSGGGGGTTVVANPSGEATAQLNKLQVGNDIYSIPSGGSGSGHTILNDGGTVLAQEDDLQFKGVYSHDDSTNGKTIVEVTRSMTLAQYQALSADEKKGVIAVTDDSPEPSYTDIVGTLVAGLTSITLSDSSITTSSTVEVFDEFDIPYNNKTLSNGSITLTFDAQQNDMIVKVRVS